MSRKTNEPVKKSDGSGTICKTSTQLDSCFNCDAELATYISGFHLINDGTENDIRIENKQPLPEMFAETNKKVDVSFDVEKVDVSFDVEKVDMSYDVARITANNKIEQTGVSVLTALLQQDSETDEYLMQKYSLSRQQLNGKL